MPSLGGTIANKTLMKPVSTFAAADYIHCTTLQLSNRFFKGGFIISSVIPNSIWMDSTWWKNLCGVRNIHLPRRFSKKCWIWWSHVWFAKQLKPVSIRADESILHWPYSISNEFCFVIPPEPLFFDGISGVFEQNVLKQSREPRGFRLLFSKGSQTLPRFLKAGESSFAELQGFSGSKKLPVRNLRRLV